MDAPLFLFTYIRVSDPLGVQGRKFYTYGPDGCYQVCEKTDSFCYVASSYDVPICLQIWEGPLSGKRIVIILWNRCSKAATITAKWDMMGLESLTSASVRDLWKVNMATLSFFSC